MGIVDTLNVDMIYNFPIQDWSMLEHDLKTLLRILPDQITFYPLMISSGHPKPDGGYHGARQPLHRKGSSYRRITSCPRVHL
ncbi:MAG: hypothetical protein MZV70_37215 [Desulfobacterales bacterium]|nr:hypothetical protein [Desulfobacterales bacterium]